MNISTIEENTILDIKAIKNMLPHRYPFLFIDRVIKLDLQNNHVVAIKCVTANEEFFNGHFPDNPIMPGVLILESLAQTGGILVCQKGCRNCTPLLLSVDHVKFRRPAVPGDTLYLHAHGIHINSKGGKIIAKALLKNNKLAVEAKINFVLKSTEQI